MAGVDDVVSECHLALETVGSRHRQDAQSQPDGMVLYKDGEFLSVLREYSDESTYQWMRMRSRNYLTEVYCENGC